MTSQDTRPARRSQDGPIRALLRRVLPPVRRVLDALAAGLLLAVLAVTASQVAARYLLGIPMPWGEELTRLLFIWLVFIGASRTRHLSVDVLPNALPPRGRRIQQIASTIFGALLLVFLIYYARNLVALTVYDRYSALGISVQYLYWAAVVGGGLWVVMSLAETCLGEEPEEDGETPSRPLT